ncbi:MAG: DNA mismatch repair endonuclease MutL, partial [Thermoplasmata archaeon]|nr:DNA mismatch repair endonuclease MutL [Thermoplasmata archaeon]
LDAGATEILVKVVGAGKSLIQVVNNGRGMGEEDALLAFRRHATSKISSIEDLDNISTMGFRGEALSSIASVSDIILYTRPAGVETGIQLKLKNGKIESKASIGMEPGTTIEIRDIFSNVPARLKFLKSDRVEMSHIIRVVTERALANPQVSFILLNGDTEAINCRASSRFEDRFLDIFGRKAAKVSVKLDAGADGIAVTGMVAKPEITKPSRDDLHIFVNGRPISDRVLASAINDGYAGMLMRNRFPVGAVFIELPPAGVDINVHPTKREVKFSEQRKVASLVKEAVADALGNTDLIREAPVIQKTLAPISSPSPSSSSSARTTTRTQAPGTGSPIAPSQSQLFEGEDAEVGHDIEVPGGKTLPAISPIGQILNTYILAQSGSALIIIDQHAAHERVMLERLRKATDGKMASQRLISPLTLELSSREKELVDHYRPILEDTGFTIEPFGRTTYLVRAVPVFGGHLEEVENILAMVQELVELGKAKSIESKRDEILHLVACHSSIRAGEPLSMSQMRRLIGEMHELDNPYTCAHGRPTIIKITDRELEKMFKRVV